MLNPYLILLAEMLLVHNPLYTLHRGLMLLDYLAVVPATQDALAAYMSRKYRVGYEEFIKQLYHIYFFNEYQNNNLNFYYMDLMAKHKQSQLLKSLERFQE